MKKLRVGIAGYGVVGKRREKAVAFNEYLQLVAICDRAFAESGTRPDNVLYFPTYQQLLEQKLDILIVCLTNDVAPDATIAGLERDMHVFCEKPPGRDLDDIAKVISTERTKPHLKLKYGFNHRYHHSVREAREKIQSGELGKVVSLRGVYGKSNLVTFNQSDWRTQRKIAGGGVLLDQGIHMVDLIRLLGGEFSQVHSFIENSFWNFDVEDNAYALLRSKEGVVAMLHSSATQWRHQFSLEVHLEFGAILLGGILSGSKSYGAETMTVIWSDPHKDAGSPKEQSTRYNVDPSWEDEINEFTEAVLLNKPIKDGSSRDAYKTMELVYRIYCADNVWKTKNKIKDKPSVDFQIP